MKINRRELLKYLAGTSLGLLLTPVKKLWGGPAKIPPILNEKWPDLVAVKDGSSAQMFERGIEYLGGMERFVKKGQTVLVKPNIGWNKTPTEGANTRPDLVGTIVSRAYQAGASKVMVFDHTCNEMGSCYRNSGIEEEVNKNKGIMLRSDKEKDYREVEIKKAKLLKKVKVHQAFLDADVVINVPVLKDHVSTMMTSALKNFMGVVWDRRYWHREGLNQCIAEFALYRKVDLTVIDAYTIMVRNGPRGISSNDLALKKMQLLSTDPVLADTAAAKILGITPREIEYLPMAEKMGLGTMSLKSSNIKRISCKA